MGNLSKESAIYLSLLLSCTPYTMIATFLPDLASSHGLPLWLIGLMFSADPISGLFAALILGKTMFYIGRKTTVLIGLLLVSLSMFALCPLEFLDRDTFIIFSFLSRIIAGASTGFIMTASDSIIISDYPDKIDTMVGRLEGAIGIGLIIGPLIGVLLYMGSLFWSLIGFGALILAFIPLCSCMLGKFREYEVSNQEMSSSQLMFKPKVLLDLGMNYMLLFTFGFVIPTLELHLLQFGLNNTWVALSFLLHTAFYASFSIFGAFFFKKLDYRTTLTLGLCLMALSFLMLGPWEVIFPKSVWIVLTALPLLGMGQAMIFIPTYPHMIETANQDYGYEKDDLLSDAISSLSNMFCDAGEIVGPILTGVLVSLIGFEQTSTILAFICFAYALVYFFSSGLFGKWTHKNKIEPDLIQKIYPEDTQIYINKSI